MRRFVATYIFLLVGVLTMQAQRVLNQGATQMTQRDQYGNPIDPSTQPDSLPDGSNIESLPPKLYMWQLSETLGERTIVPADTANLNFQNTNLVEGMEGH